MARSLLVVAVTATILCACSGAPGLSTPPVPSGWKSGSTAALAAGQWSTVALPPGAETTWDLAAWTGKYVIAWGSTEPCCTASSGPSDAGSSEHGAALDPTAHTWRRLPRAPVSFTVESTIWTGRIIFAWGSTPPGSGATPAIHNVLLSFDPASWSWGKIPSPKIPPRSEAEVAWTGTRLIVFGGEGPSGTLLDGASYDLATNRWSPLPALPQMSAPAGSRAEPVGTTAVWAGDALYVWVTRQVSRTTPDGGEIYAGIQALRWPGTGQWQAGPKPPSGVSVFDATAVSTGSDIAVLNGSFCLPDESCPARETGSAALYQLTSRTWSSVPADAVLENPGSLVWTGRTLVVVSPYLTADGYVVGGYAAGFVPSGGIWASLPELPVPGALPTGATVMGAVWDGSELIDSGVVLTPASGASRGVTVSSLPTCPPISFPDWVGGTFCGPAPGPGNGNGPDGSCLGNETTPPCGPGIVAGGTTCTRC